MIRTGVMTAGLAAALAIGLAVGVGYTGVSDIFGTAHDLGASGNPTCRQCHVPHNAQGSYLWARTPKTGMSGLQALCFSCHDGTVTDVGQFIADPSYVSHPVSPGDTGNDCDRCHDPHTANWKFVTDDAIPAEYRNANLCDACHDTATVSHPLTSTDAPIDRTWDPYATPPDFSGTRLWDVEGFQPGSTMKCLTCHTVHGAAQGTALNTMPWETSDGQGDPEAVPICENCHGRPRHSGRTMQCVLCHTAHGALEGTALNNGASSG